MQKCMALWKVFLCCQSNLDSFPQFPWSLLGTPGTTNPLLVRRHEKIQEGKKERNARLKKDDLLSCTHIVH